MKHTLILVTALLLAPLAASAPARPEVATATKAARRAWESAPAEKKALWLPQREALKHIDLSEDTTRQIIIVLAIASPVLAQTATPARFQRCDRDGDGRLTRDEVTEVTQVTEVTALTAADADKDDAATVTCTTVGRSVCRVLK